MISIRTTAGGRTLPRAPHFAAGCQAGRRLPACVLVPTLEIPRLRCSVWSAARNSDAARPSRIAEIRPPSLWCPLLNSNHRQHQAAGGRIESVRGRTTVRLATWSALCPECVGHPTSYAAPSPRSPGIGIFFAVPHFVIEATCQNGPRFGARLLAVPCGPGRGCRKPAERRAGPAGKPGRAARAAPSLAVASPTGGMSRWALQRSGQGISERCPG